MDQKTFSKFIHDFLKTTFPEFVPTINYHADDSFDCTQRSPSNVFSIWLATYNSEITIGLEAPDGSSDIHSHISCYTPEDLNICLSQLSDFIEDIKNDRIILYRNQNGKYDWIDSLKFYNKINSERFSWNLANEAL